MYLHPAPPTHLPPPRHTPIAIFALPDGNMRLRLPLIHASYNIIYSAAFWLPRDCARAGIAPAPAAPFAHLHLFHYHGATPTWWWSFVVLDISPGLTYSFYAVVVLWLYSRSTCP